MPVTLKEILNTSIMSQAKVRTCSSVSLIIRPVESIAVIEIPVENFVRKNELVLSTAMGCNNDLEIFSELVQNIIDSEAAALVIAVGRHVKSIPEEILQLADKQGFPIIEIPWEIRFADIIDVVLTELHNWHLNNLKKYEGLRNKLLNLFLGDFSLSDALELLRKELGSPAIIIDNEGKIKGRSNYSDAFLEILTPYLNKAFSLENNNASVEALDLPEDSILKYSIQSADKHHGYMLMELKSVKVQEAYFVRDKDNILRHIIPIIMLWFQREQAIRETEIRLRDDFVWSIAKGEIDSWEHMSSRAKSLGYDLTVPYVCIVGLFDDLEKSYKHGRPMEADYEQWLYQSINTVKEQVLWVGKHLKLKVMVTYQQERLVVFLEVQDNQIHKIPNSFLDIVENRLHKFLPGMIMSWGIGENHVGLKTFSESFMDANTALDMCYRQEGPGHRSTYARTGIYRVLGMLSSNPELQEISRLAIGELIKYDEHRGLNLLDTLKTYIQNQGNVSRTARELNLHRQSLLYRLRKIEALTNRSLVNTDDLFLLDLCIRLWMHPKK